MRLIFGFGMLAASVAVMIASGDGNAQIGGALQYPPPAVGEDAQPPPPARMVPQAVSPRQIELGVSGSSQPPAGYGFSVHPPAEIGPIPKGPPSQLDPPFALPPTTAGN